MLQKVESMKLSPMLHHQHTQITVTEPLEMMSRTAHQDQGSASQAPRCARTGAPRCPEASSWHSICPPGTKQGGQGRQAKTRRKDCVQPLPESNIPEIIWKWKGEARPTNTTSCRGTWNLKLKVECQIVFKCDNSSACYVISLVCYNPANQSQAKW